ncbi:MAG: hypothetical protein Q8927_05105 [Bacteroidota bacterium]|nr:hypothetical protein [Bacteroidota bacterium]MDP4215558.1 hypothetical protein [Bacteroidota bacterium]MDP4244774.1 hypothetical protein [Bacteroidota bacterium]MDP4253865.1 hypothetical protein [Bacteroidota bacterium]MDP4258226.1 hypothetical protein [Bacteroidota bacterium]
MTLFTPEDLLLYLYKESSPELTVAIDTALKEDWMLHEKLLEIQSQSVTDEMDKVIVSPRAEVILRVMNYARETAVESMPH